MGKEHSIPADVIDFLEQKGIASRIAAARRVEVEQTRLGLIREVDDLRAENDRRVPPALERVRKAESDKLAAETALTKARQALMRANEELAAVDSGTPIERRLGELARLADPLIHLAVRHLHGCMEAIRGRGLAQWTDSEKSWDLTRVIRSEYSNADSVNRALDELRSAVAELELLLHRPCPSGLVETIEKLVEVADSKCLGLGVHIERQKDLVTRLELMRHG